MIHLTVTMQIKPGHMDAFLAVCRELRPLVLAEKGCLRYEYTREVALPFMNTAVDPNRITLLETWASEADLAVHNEAPHMKKYVPLLVEHREGRDLRVLTPIF